MRSNMTVRFRPEAAVWNRRAKTHFAKFSMMARAHDQTVVVLEIDVRDRRRPKDDAFSIAAAFLVSANYG